MKETMINSKVSYPLTHRGKFFIIEHVPARICLETGEQYFSPKTVEHLQKLITGKRKPTRTVVTPVFEYA
ncbi:MAG: hypothetical protein A2487_02390 [Candidatus Raymondbacteria bacterium RifOxyC12_full_50_8]|uniref:YgiT-type zinc finger domain-containing protein n=1 Tax=Candidatus Raymondbacteria bacterium RIFOXYD12_FULL_49_13 TaxID=1817890 RepID=A0A1F7FHR7_UNCRA|nr:MAG: hypothetical protein A2248_20935 [Candidatus Raymondbacteria bacterium RIFOXYA2_FULL_49_16]OGJ99526.1 MAG: hypothetical protein A2350_05500 [Candidatus Raymondbacteria bacterium RifOxyB12_full_50_8]OGK06255.1 MAG: hypothetical protein A2519_08250 [Candidatus Raymondbacteria bacterium RIFOXYD12_FULL_49_13]OGK07712.1 MAG: hypothetical protein A2487_02390 [Candidatus Raymondbacteria bacterium RifOxyC12_full_50_8]OGP40587.1 MAG: hypothetical protein A2324_03005 [Candidatus Raymondbacteria b